MKPNKEEDKSDNKNKLCSECNHEEKYHTNDDGWISCSFDNWSCNCGNNIGR